MRLIWSLLLLSFVAGCGSAPPDYDVYLVKYGTTDDVLLRKHVTSFNYLEGDAREATAPVTLTFGVIEGAGRLCLVNTGLPATDRRVRDGEVKGFVDPVVALERAGWNPENVTHLLLTDATWSAIGNVPRFPRAVVYFQKEEHRRLGRTKRGVLAENRDEDLLVLLRGDARPLPGIELLELGRATSANQVVAVSTGSGPVVFMGALAPFFKNIERGSGPPIAASHYGAAKAIERLERSYTVFVPSMDRGIETRFTEVKENLWRVER